MGTLPDYMAGGYSVLCRNESLQKIDGNSKRWGHETHLEVDVYHQRKPWGSKPSSAAMGGHQRYQDEDNAQPLVAPTLLLLSALT